MKKYYIIWIVCNLLAIVGCTNEGDNPVGNQKGIELRNFSNSGCKNCICPYDLSYEIGPLVEGMTYVIYIGHKGNESKVAEFEFLNSISGVWEVKTNNYNLNLKLSSIFKTK